MSSEKRNLYFILTQFCKYYKSQRDVKDIVVDVISRQDLEQVFSDRLLLDENSFIDVTEEKQQELLQLYFDTFDLYNNQQVAIMPHLVCDFVVDTEKNSPQECAQQIQQDLNLFVESSALRKNYKKSIV